MAEILTGCPGANRYKNPTITEKICPVCGNVLELFSTDVSVQCQQCGFVAYNDMDSCVKWCKYAKLCVGPQLYEQLRKAPDASNK